MLVGIREKSREDNDLKKTFNFTFPFFLIILREFWLFYSFNKRLFWAPTKCQALDNWIC